MAKTLYVHPDDLNLADVKAACARLGVDAVGSRVVPRGQMFLGEKFEGPLMWEPHNIGGVAT